MQQEDTKQRERESETTTAHVLDLEYCRVKVYLCVDSETQTELNSPPFRISATIRLDVVLDHPGDNRQERD